MIMINPYAFSTLRNIVYQGNGGIAAVTNNSSVTVTYPSGIVANDIIFLQVLANGDRTFSTPSNFTLIYRVNDADRSVGFFYRRASSSLSGTLSVSTGSVLSNGLFGVMSRWSGCKTSDNPYSSKSNGLNTGDFFGIGPVSNTLIKYIQFISMKTSFNIPDPTTYDKNFELTSSAGDGATLSCYSATTNFTQKDIEYLDFTGNTKFWGILQLSFNNS